MTPDQRANLEKLAAYLAAGDTRMKFDMGHVCVQGDYGIVFPWLHECGTQGCALGHGPSAGIPADSSGENWLEYCDRALGIAWHSEEWCWCFGADWDLVDNTPQGAARRIRHMLEHGVPIDGRNQRWGVSPYIFADASE